MEAITIYRGVDFLLHCGATTTFLFRLEVPLSLARFFECRPFVVAVLVISLWTPPALPLLTYEPLDLGATGIRGGKGVLIWLG